MACCVQDRKQQDQKPDRGVVLVKCFLLCLSDSALLAAEVHDVVGTAAVAVAAAAAAAAAFEVVTVATWALAVEILSDVHHFGGATVVESLHELCVDEIHQIWQRLLELVKAALLAGCKVPRDKRAPPE